jgi:hypothetical protein
MNRSKGPICHHRLGDFLYADLWRAEARHPFLSQTP